jgi:endonuclease G, mitochondrial
MGELSRVREAERDVQNAAMKRWLKRTSIRKRNKSAIQSHGVGAADSPMRNARFRARQASMARARELRQAGQLPLGLERKMGATLDFRPFAPSEVARKAGRPVARIVELSGPGVQPSGIATGFLIAPRLLLTNHHVFPDSAAAVGTGANFLYERSERGLESGVIFELDPSTFFLADEALDFAIVAVKPDSNQRLSLGELGIITLIEAIPKILKGHPVHIIQHPDGGEKQYAVTENRLVDVMDEGFVHYETDTLRGSSGSPAFSQDWELVALHHSSIPASKDGKILSRRGGFWSEEMGDDEVRWIANEGIRVSAIVGRLAHISLNGPQQSILKELLASTVDPMDELPQAPIVVASPPQTVTSISPQTGTSISPVIDLKPAINLNEDSMGNIQFTFTGPVVINVQAPAAHDGLAVATAVNAPAQSVAPALSAPEATMRFDPKYKNRKGYDPGFLDPDGKIVVPIPEVAPKRRNELLLDGDGNPQVLKYHHFELVMNKARRLQMWSAGNVDYDKLRKSQRDRKEFGTDKWIPDKRIPADAQIFDADFYKPAGNIDRGHIVRREDNAWGDTEEEVEFANSDTFHWTNCTPQH